MGGRKDPYPENPRSEQELPIVVEAADKIVSAIQKNILDGKVKTCDMGGKNTTSDVGNDIARIIKGE